MSWLLFLDESGHDHQTTPYEVRGGIALHARKLWPFVQAMKQMEQSSFGDFIHRYRSELKGHRLLNKKRWKWAAQDAPLDDVARRKHCLSFLNKGVQGRRPTRVEFTAYGQACLMFARGLFPLLESYEAKLYASAIPCDVTRPATYEAKEYLRKDHVFLFERYFYQLERNQEHGLLVLDESDKQDDRRFVRRVESYFTKTQTGRQRTAWIVPAPLFVSSDMAYPVQAADIAIYCVNWGFRLRSQGMGALTRQEIEDEFSPWLRRLQFEGDGYRDGRVYHMYGITYVENPYGRGRIGLADESD